MLSVLSQWDSDVARGKESEEKLQGLFKQQQKLFQQQRIVQAETQDYQAAARTIHEGTSVCVCVCVCVCLLALPLCNSALVSDPKCTVSCRSGQSIDMYIYTLLKMGCYSSTQSAIFGTVT